MPKGLNSVKNVDGVKVLCIVSYDAYICTKFHESTFSNFIVIQST